MAKSRLTITLDNQVLHKLDKFVDGKTIRNRSHAIEFILSKSLIPQGTKVVILAGGQGINMRPFTYEIPKSLIPVHGRPLLEYTIENLAKYDFREIIISIGHLGEKIIEHFGDGKKFGVNITYIKQGTQEKGTAAPLVPLKKAIGDNRFLVIYGDVLTDINYLELVEFHGNHGKTATMALTSLADTSGWGVAYLLGNKISSFIEKPKNKDSGSHLVNSGIYVFEPKIFNLLNNQTKSLEKEVLPKLMIRGDLYGYNFFNEWYDLGSLPGYEKAIRRWKK